MSGNVHRHESPPIDGDALELREQLYIESSPDLAAFISSLKQDESAKCAVDTEADSLHCYEEKLCLIQFTAEERVAIIDPLAIDDLSPLMEYLNRAENWMHGADFDMRMLRARFNAIPPIVFDTQIAARLLGSRKFGLANIVEEFCGVKLSKHSQKADWGKRPLPEKMVSYAVNDVRYLLAMADYFRSHLTELGRWDWFLQSCDAARDAASKREERDPDAVWRITGWGKLKSHGLAYLRGLWNWRDDEARRRDRPPFKIVGNEKLLQFSNSLADGGTASVPPKLGKQTISRFEAAIEEVRALPESDWPKIPKRQRSPRDPNFDAKFTALRKVRDDVARELDIEPSLLGSRSVLEKLAVDRSLAPELLLPWQRELLGLD